METEKLLKDYGMTYSRQLGIDLKKPNELFRWFLASILFARPIQETVAIKTYGEFEREGLLTPGKIREAGWNRLVEVLDRGGYVRYDFSTASKLLEISEMLVKKYGGRLEKLHALAADSKDLEARLQEFKGVGPMTANIFLRELRTVWKKADPEPSELVRKTARRLKIKLPAKRKTESFVRLEAELVRTGLILKKRNPSGV